MLGICGPILQEFVYVQLRAVYTIRLFWEVGGVDFNCTHCLEFNIPVLALGMLTHGSVALF